MKKDTYGEESISVAGSYNNMAVIHEQMKDVPLALKCFDKALDIKSKCLGPGHLSVAATLKNKGDTLMSDGKFEDALVAFDMAVKIEKAAFNDYHDSIASTLAKISVLLSRMGRADEAVAAHQASEHVQQTVFSRLQPLQNH